jgi:hypothetical protein
MEKTAAQRQNLLVDLGDEWYKHAKFGNRSGLPGARQDGCLLVEGFAENESF